MQRIGVDTGGTFTDFVWLEDGCRRTLKVPSTPSDPARAVLEGLAMLLATPTSPEGCAASPDAGPTRSLGSAMDVKSQLASGLPEGTVIVHGSTVATNALLEGKVAAVALLTNRGFEDVLAIGRQNRPDLYDAGVLPPEPLVPAECRLGIAGRLGPDGEELEPVDAGQVAALVRERMAAGIRRFAVCLLHSYADRRHEDEVGRVITAAGGEVTLSADILPEYREYERTSTTVVNAALEPVMTGYLSRLETALPGARLTVFRSNGGVLSAAAAGAEAVQTLLSGPAAGVLGAASWGRRCGLPRLITFDMGGTSTDVALVDGEPAVTTESSIGGHPVRLPMIDIHTVGAGGGSLARRDRAGALLVGPESAGADPGPACYGHGRQATVTDAQVVLGRLPADFFLGGSMTLHQQRAQDALSALAAEMGCSPGQAAEGVVTVANAGMARAVRVVSLARGHDPRDFALFCFGGAGGLHAADLAASLGIRQVVVPPGSGTFSAYGMMTADVVRDASRAVLRPLAEVGLKAREDLARPLVERLQAEMEQEGFAPGRVDMVRSLDLRYRGQSFELTVPDGGDPEAAFHELHARRYGHQRPDHAVELVVLRLRAIGPVLTPDEQQAAPCTAPPAALTGRRVRHEGREMDAALYRRDDLSPGHRLAGPAIIAASGSTVWVPPRWQGEVDAWSNLCLTPADGLQVAG